MNLFEYSDYRKYLADRIAAQGQGRGYKSRLSEALGQAPSFLSQVLHKSVEFTPDHAFRISRFWSFDPIHHEYWMTLVHFARASSPDFKKSLSEKLDALRSESLNMAARFKEPGVEDQKFAERYYSNWHFAAIHMLLTLPQMKSPERIAAHLNLGVDHVIRIIEELQRMGLVEAVDRGWKAKLRSLHLPRGSPLSTMNHQIWRNHAIDQLLSGKNSQDKSLNYSTLYSLSHSDFEKLKQLTLKFVEETRTLVIHSKEEVVVGLNIDCFEI